MGLPYSSTMANVHDEKTQSAAESARVLLKAIELDPQPRDIVTRKSIEHAVSVIIATGRSTNAVFNILALPPAPGGAWTTDDFDRVLQPLPVFGDPKEAAWVREWRWP